MSQAIIREIEKSQIRAVPFDFQVGDTVKVKVLIREGTKERHQSFEGMVIAMKGGAINKTFTVRRIFQGVAIERTFLFNSPKVIEVKSLRKGKARRAKLYYMRNLVGTKKTRLREDSSRIAKDFQQRLIDQETAKADKKQAKAAKTAETSEASEATV